MEPTPSPVAREVMPLRRATILPPMTMYIAHSDPAISAASNPRASSAVERCPPQSSPTREMDRDRKSTRLNSSHVSISYAVFCLKKKIKTGLASYELGYDKST